MLLLLLFIIVILLFLYFYPAGWGPMAEQEPEEEKRIPLVFWIVPAAMCMALLVAGYILADAMGLW